MSELHFGVWRLPAAFYLRGILRLLFTALCFMPVQLGACASATDSQSTRIVSLVPGLTETLFAMGAGKQLVGVSDFCNYPPEAKLLPRVGGLGNPRLEQLLQLRPTVVLLYRSQADFAEKLRVLNVGTRLYNVDRLDDLYTVTKELGQVTGLIQQSDELVSSMTRAIEAIHSNAKDRTPARAMIIVSRDPTELRNLYQAGSQNFLGELLQNGGGRLAIPVGAAITKEQLILADPEVIIDLSGGESAAKPGAAAAALKLWSQLNTVSAVKNHRVHYVSDSHALVPGPYLTKTAEMIESLLHPKEERSALH